MKACFNVSVLLIEHKFTTTKNTQAMREKTKVYDMKLLRRAQRRAQEDEEGEAPGPPSL